MDFNREEAQRAKGRAEELMNSGEFVTARRLLRKAAGMDSNLDVSQMVQICDVHCAAEVTFGKDLDWYSILGIEPVADATAVKKNYRRLALILHPDKNCFPGANAAFQMVGQAYAVLSNEENRKKHDAARGISRQMPTWRQPECNQWTPSYPWNEYPGSTSHQEHPTSTTSHRQHPHTTASHRQHPTSTASHRQHPHTTASHQQHPTSTASHQQHPTSTASHQQHPTSTASYREQHPSRSSTRKRPRFVYYDSSSDSSSDSDSSSGEDEKKTQEDVYEVPFVNLSDDEEKKAQKDVKEVPIVNLSDDEEKRTQEEDVHDVQEEKKTHEEEDVRDVQEEKKTHEEDVDEGEEKKQAHERGTIFYEYEGPQFFDFDKLREEGRFGVNQIWALYDNQGGMPRVYALIRIVTTGDFNLSCAWLDLDEDEDEDERPELPVSVGKYRVGEMVDVNRLTMVSHFVCNITGRVTRATKFTVFPNKGETWALFKNWDILIKSTGSVSPSEYEYEFVEILSDHAVGNKVSVGFLSKVEGYVSVFRPVPNDGSCEILPQEYFRFSHRVPSVRLTGTEGGGGLVADGWYELDPAATS